jgi:hypothetical protein
MTLSAQQKKYWESLSDEELVASEMITDDPERLDGLVKEVPPGDEEPYVEYKYDQTKSGREEFSCVHGHHRHLKGFVMRKGKARFLVGWMCGKTIYGADFDALTADFDAAVTKRDSLRRIRGIKEVTEPFVAWLNQVSESDVFTRFDSAREQIYEHMQWIHDKLYLVSAADIRAQRTHVPTKLFDENNDPEVDWKKAASEFNTLAMKVVARNGWAEKNIAHLKRTMEGLLQRFEAVLKRLKELEDFFQPQVLALVCEYANVHDNPKKRKYMPGLLSITCKRGKQGLTVHMPKSFKVPSNAHIEEFRKKLSGVNF